MSKARMINTKFWDDTYISNLDPIEKLLFLYLLTNPTTNICGVYELPLKNIALDTGIEKEMVQKIISRFSEDGKIFHIDGWIVIRNFIKHQANNPKVLAGVRYELANVPKQLLKYINFTHKQPKFKPSRKKITKGCRLRIMEKCGSKCVECGSIESLEIDHIVPLSMGGTNNDDNLQVLCTKCNGKKNANLRWKNNGDLEYRTPIEENILPTEMGGLSHSNSNLNSNLNSNINKVDLYLSELLLKLIWENTPTFKEPSLEKWAEHVRLMRERDGRTKEQIEFVIRWAQQSDFWQANILSTQKLRQKFDTLVAQIKRDTKTKIPNREIIL